MIRNELTSCTARCQSAKNCCLPPNPCGGAEEESYDARLLSLKIPQKILKGGSHLCAPSY